MVQQISEGVSVTVETFYQDAQSNPLRSDYLFAYRITIENLSSLTLQLLNRHWIIVDSCRLTREVKGEGVVGRQPVLEPNASYQYVSAVNLNSDIGKMYGQYTMIDLSQQKTFQVAIPEFALIAPFKFN